MSKYIKLDVDKDEFKKIRKGKQLVVIRLNNDEVKDINNKTKIIFKSKIDRLIKKVKEIHSYPTLKELVENVDKKKLGYKKKDTPNYEDLTKSISEEDINKYGIVGIELRKKKHIFRKVLLVLLAFTIIFTGYRFVKNKLIDMRIQKVKNSILEVNKEKISYVFIEINPSMVLTVKDNKISDIACLNDDCVIIYDKLNVIDKDINKGIDTIYNISKENGFDISNGVRVKSTDNINIEKKDYINFEQISTDDEKQLLNNVINNEEIKSIDNDDYYSKLWDTLKKDKSYDKIYSCSMNSNKELECYINQEWFDSLPNYGLNQLGEFVANLDRILDIYREWKGVYDSFNVRYTTEYYSIADTKLESIDTFYVNGVPCRYIDYQSGHDIYYSHVLDLSGDDSDIKRLLPITKLNLVNSSYKNEDVIVVDTSTIVYEEDD